MRFEIYGKADKSRWRLKASNGQTVASSGEAFASHANAARAAQSFKKGAAKATFEVYADRSAKFRWRAKSSNGQTVASSGAGVRLEGQREARRRQRPGEGRPGDRRLSAARLPVAARAVRPPGAR